MFKFEQIITPEEKVIMYAIAKGIDLSLPKNTVHLAKKALS